MVFAWKISQYNFLEYANEFLCVKKDWTSCHMKSKPFLTHALKQLYIVLVFNDNHFDTVGDKESSSYRVRNFIFYVLKGNFQFKSSQFYQNFYRYCKTINNFLSKSFYKCICLFHISKMTLKPDANLLDAVFNFLKSK